MIPIRSALPVALSLAASASLACGFHGYSPQPSLVERLLVSDHIVLARNDPQNPFAYKAVRAIEGSLDHVELPHLVDSATRRRFDLNPDATVLFARDGDYGPWQRLTYVGPELAPVIERIAPRLDDWQMGGDEERFQIFADLIGSEDPALQGIALRELDTADYYVFRRLDLKPDAEAIGAQMYRPEGAGLLAIRILLLGMAEGEVADTLLRRGFALTLKSGGPLLGAYSTALIELNGTEAVSLLAQTYLADTTIPLDVRESIAEALAIHGIAGDPTLQPEISEAVSAALEAAPDLAPAVARQFGFRAEWSQFATLNDLLRSGKIRAAPDILAVSQYLAMASNAGAAPMPDGN
ncbi:hypothetical protein [Aliiruegeria haliotis]|nr:hypothetical protein [Aliiruegeria haliotis]